MCARPFTGLRGGYGPLRLSDPARDGARGRGRLSLRCPRTPASRLGHASAGDRRKSAGAAASRVSSSTKSARAVPGPPGRQDEAAPPPPPARREEPSVPQPRWRPPRLSRARCACARRVPVTWGGAWSEFTLRPPRGQSWRRRAGALPPPGQGFGRGGCGCRR